MPIYECKCECGNVFRGIYGENAEIKCLKCGSSELEKSIVESILPDSNSLQDISPVCVSCTKQNCDTCKIN